jgi:hypothetical protein
VRILTKILGILTSDRGVGKRYLNRALILLSRPEEQVILLGETGQRTILIALGYKSS